MSDLIGTIYNWEACHAGLWLRSDDAFVPGPTLMFFAQTHEREFQANFSEKGSF
jgi:hypothetical protein